MRKIDPPAEPHTKRSIPEEYDRPRLAGPMLSQPAFDWKGPDRYVEMWDFEMEVANMLQEKTYDLNDEEEVPIIKNWL